MTPVAIRESLSPIAVSRLAFTKSPQRFDPSTFNPATFNFCDSISLRTLGHSADTFISAYLSSFQAPAHSWTKNRGGRGGAYQEGRRPSPGTRSETEHAGSGRTSFELRFSHFQFPIFCAQGASAWGGYFLFSIFCFFSSIFSFLFSLFGPSSLSTCPTRHPPLACPERSRRIGGCTRFSIFASAFRGARA